MIEKPKDKQHHGNLKEALVLAGMKLLEEEGLEALTLRRCAALAGVSHAAPAHHFEGIKGLRTAIATRGYAIFDKLVKDGMNAAGPDKRAQAIGMARGYIRFATEHNALFNLILDRPDKFIQSKEWEVARTTSRQILTDVASQFEAGSGGPTATEVALFSITHGYSKLIEIGRVVPGSGDGRDVKFEDIFDFMNFKPTLD